MWVYAERGVIVSGKQQFVFGPKLAPKASWGVTLGGTDAGNHEESDHSTPTSATPPSRNSSNKSMYS